jgi:hypothetical protein
VWIEHPAKSRGGERHCPEPPDHHGIGDGHRHLREIGRSERRRQHKRRTNLRSDVGSRDTATVTGVAMAA